LPFLICQRPNAAATDRVQIAFASAGVSDNSLCFSFGEIGAAAGGAASCRAFQSAHSIQVLVFSPAPPSETFHSNAHKTTAIVPGDIYATNAKERVNSASRSWLSLILLENISLDAILFDPNNEEARCCIQTLDAVAGSKFKMMYQNLVA
jgi:hypothetical protein